MIIGIGVDLVDMRRIDHLLQKFRKHFIQRVFTDEEQAYASQAPYPLRAYTNRFAAKEAAAKALGTGMRKGIGWKDIEVILSNDEEPAIGTQLLQGSVVTMDFVKNKLMVKESSSSKSRKK